MKICVIGLNHHTAPVHVRERVSLAGGLAPELLRAMREEKIFQEAVVLDTCNRTEVYYVPGERDDAIEHMLAHIAQLKGTTPLEDTSAFYRHEGLEAVAHLFRVTAGLDSQVVGEDEILGQVRAAYSQAVQARTARFLLNRLMHRALRVGKRVRTETELGQGSASVAQAAVELARHVFSSLEGKVVLLVGAGQTAELAARALIRSGAARLIVANRTLSRAEKLAADLLSAEGVDEAAVRAACKEPDDEAPARCPALPLLAPECTLEDTEAAGLTARAVELPQIPSVIGEVDLVISSTGAQGYVLRHEDLADHLRRLGHSLLIVDIAVPRDVDPRLETSTSTTSTTWTAAWPRRSSGAAWRCPGRRPSSAGRSSSSPAGSTRSRWCRRSSSSNSASARCSRRRSSATAASSAIGTAPNSRSSPRPYAARSSTARWRCCASSRATT
jgi:glutamyl-tRNA reductase